MAGPRSRRKLIALSGALALGCGIRIARDLTETPQIVVYDDMCGVQEYHDRIAMGIFKAPEVVKTQEIERSESAKTVGGQTTFAFASEPQLLWLRKVLAANWKELPEPLMKANRIELEVRWAEKAGVRRVVTTEAASIAADGQSWDLPYHICLSELLFGRPLYDTRRQALDLPPLPLAPVDSGVPEPKPHLEGLAPLPPQDAAAPF